MRVLTQAQRLGLATAALQALFVPEPALAVPVDLAAATCADVLRMDADERRQLVLWLAGYYAGSSGRPAIDLDRVLAGGEALDQVCQRRGDLPIIGAEARALLAGELTAAQVAPPPPPAAPAPPAGPPGRRPPRPLPSR